MSRDNYRYVPLAGLRNLKIEVELNPYAMFTGGL